MQNLNLYYQYQTWDDISISLMITRVEILPRESFCIKNVCICLGEENWYLPGYFLWDYKRDLSTGTERPCFKIQFENFCLFKKWVIYILRSQISSSLHESKDSQHFRTGGRGGAGYVDIREVASFCLSYATLAIYYQTAKNFL